MLSSVIVDNKPNFEINNNRELSFYYQNCRGLRSKTSQFFSASSLNEFSVIALTETWLDNSIFSSELFSDNYNVYRADRNYQAMNCSRGGGVLLAINKCWSSSQVIINTNDYFLHLQSIDILIVKISTKCSQLYIILIYVPPNTSNNDFELLFESLESLEFMYENDILLLGDFNITSYISHVLHSTSSTQVSLLENFLQIFDLTQYNKVLNGHDRILDLIISNGKCSVSRCLDPLLNEDTHHPALSFECTLDLNPGRKNNFQKCFHNSYNFRKANFPVLYRSISNIDWNFLEVFENVEDATTYFYGKLYSVFDKCVPIFKTPRKRNYPPWFTIQIINKIKLKTKVHHKFRQFNDPRDYDEFSRLRRDIKSEIDASYSEYITDLESGLKANPNRFWSFVNNKKGKSRIDNKMNYNGVSLDTPENILNAFADFFAQSYGPSSLSQVDETIELSLITNVLNIPSFSQDEILTALKQIKPKMTTGPDDIPAFIVRDCAQILAPPLTVLINLCLKYSIFPNSWKISKVCPVYKKGNQCDIVNFRPISIISNFSKVFEIVLYNRLYNHVCRQISPFQHGFMKGRSTVTNLINITQFIAESIDKQTQTDVIYTDFSKAFDKLDHNILIKRLIEFGLSLPLISLFKSYLLHRRQYVSFCGIKSTEYLASSGVPQGSNLGPLLFNIFINNIINNISVHYLLYADDMKLFCEIKTIDDCIRLSNCCENVVKWCSDNKLPLNPSKCCFMSYTLKSNKLAYPYAIDNVTLNNPTTIVDLGVTFDQQLSFTKHIENIVAAANRSYGFLVRNSRDFRNISSLKILYYAYVRSKLEYASIVWSPFYFTWINLIEKVQRRFLKYISLKIDGTYPLVGVPNDTLLQRHHMNSLNSRRDCYAVMFVHKLINNNIDDSTLLGYLNFLTPRLSSRNTGIFYLPTPRTNVFLNSPVYKLCQTCNKFSDQLDLVNMSIKSIRSLCLS